MRTSESYQKENIHPIYRDFEQLKVLERNGSPSNVSVGSGGLLVSQGCCMDVGWTIIKEMVGMSFRMAGGQGAGPIHVLSVELGKKTQKSRL